VTGHPRQYRPLVVVVLARAFAALVALMVIGLVAAVPAAALQLATVRISGRFPFFGRCGAAGNPQFTPGSAVEPDLAVDPGEPKDVVAAWIQDDGSAIVTSSSRDGGRTWK
jgi:hypothetical protein